MNERKTLDERAQMTDLERLRHSCAHVMATAILRIWPDAQFAYGPPIESGFYYDFEMEHRITPDDFEKIEAEMKKVAKENQKFEYKAISREEAKAMAESGRLGGLTERPGNPSRFKLDLIDKIPEGEQISCFQNGEFIDLCAGPHVGYTSKCKNVKLMSVSSSFYLGDESKGQLQRLYGTAFENKELLEEHLNRLEEAKKRDHRRLGREMALFHIDEMVGQGLILWKPKGALVRRALQDFITEELDKQGYSQVFTPHIGKLDLYRTSGHFPYYQDSQFPAIAERDTLEKLADEDATCATLINGLEQGTYEGYMLKPMNCPHHIKIFASDHHSYRDLPVRLAEFGTVYRWEQSGELNGMTRVRGFTQDDAHLFCTPDQVAAEVTGCLDLVKKVLKTLGMNDYRVRLSLRDPDSDKYVGSPENWDKAEAALREAVQTLGVDYTEEIGEAAFYGPKIDFVVKDVIGRDWQLGTVQVDYNLPVRFDLSYIGADNQPHAPGHDPPRALRLDGAFHRRAHRALRRQVPHLARPGTSARPAHLREDPRRSRGRRRRARRSRRPRHRGPGFRETRSQDPPGPSRTRALHARHRPTRSRGRHRLRPPPRQGRPRRETAGRVHHGNPTGDPKPEPLIKTVGERPPPSPLTPPRRGPARRSRSASAPR